MAVHGRLGTTGAGTLVMTNLADQVTVGGDATFDGGDETGDLTAGTLKVAGNFTQAATTSTKSFVASPPHTTLLNGTTIQAISFADDLASAFGNLSLAAGANVQVINATSVPGVTGNFDMATGSNIIGIDLSINGNGLNVFGNVTTAAVSTLAMGRMYMAGSMNIGNAGGFSVTSIILDGTGQTADPNLPYQNLFTSGTVAFGAGTPTITAQLDVTAGTLTLNGTTTSALTQVQGGSLILNGQQLNVNGDFATSGSGVLNMKNAADRLVAAGNMTFDGGDETNLLSAGQIVLQGAPGSSFKQLATNSPTSFLASGSHSTSIAGSYLISFATTASHFENLTLQASNPIAINSDLIVAGSLTSGPTGETILGGGHTVTVRSVAVTGLTVDNAKMVVNENGTGQAEQFDNVTFQNFPTTATSDILLSVTGPGAALAPRTIHVQQSQLADHARNRRSLCEADLQQRPGSHTDHAVGQRSHRWPLPQQSTVREYRGWSAYRLAVTPPVSPV